MAKRVAAAGHRVTLVTSGAYFPAHYRLPDPVSRLTIDGIDLRVIRVPYSNKLSFPRRIKAFLEFAWKAAAEAARVRDADVVFASSTPLTIALPAIWAKRRLGIPMVFEVRDLWPELPIAVGALRNPLAKWAARRLERLAYSESARLVALSEGMRDGVARVDGRPELVTVVPNSADVELFRVPASAGEEFLRERPELRGSGLVLYGGTLGIINEVEYLVDVAAEMLRLDPSIKFALIGDGNRKESVLARAREKGVLGVNLWHYPPIRKKEMPKALSACSVSVSTVIDIPELKNNSANKFFDALAAGRPMMINHEGWLADVIRSGGCGLVTPAGRPDEAARRLRAFLADKEGLRRAGEAAGRLADERYGRDILFRKLLRTIEEARGV